MFGKINNFLLILFIILGKQGISQKDTVISKYHFTSSKMIIGDQIILNVNLEFSKDYTVDWSSIKDSLDQKVEILNDFPEDTLAPENLNTLKLQKKFLITIFDSGNYFIKPLYLALSNKMDEKQYIPIFGDSLQVMNPLLDVSKDFKDIKTIEDEPFNINEYLIYIQILAAIILLSAFAYVLNRRIKQKKAFIPIFMSKPKPAHLIAFSLLKKLDEKKLWQAGEFKNYYSELTDIFRHYLQNRFGFQAMESLSSEIIHELNILEINQNSIEKIRIVLELSDNVKFAKATPLPNENLLSFETVYEFVDSTKANEDSNRKEVKL